ncbi:MAG: hypothetical protein QOE92_1629, partial [Chloroflexota bacterium]|nr:hypothetical protein [Chloroflexota bacterium]
TEPSWLGIQLAFAGGIRLEALEPIPAPADDFLARFLEHSGPGPHHVTFKVPDIEAALAALERSAIEPMKVDLHDPNWKEAFIHPHFGVGTVVQLAQAGGEWTAEHAPRDPDVELVEADFLGAELEVDPAAARKLFGDVLGGAAAELADGAVAYSWAGGGTLLATPTNGRPRLARLVFRLRDDGRGNGAAADLPGEQPLYDGPATVLRLAPDAPWPSR